MRGRAIRTFMTVCTVMLTLAGLLSPAVASDRAFVSPAATRVLETMIREQEPRVSATLARIAAADRRLLALRSYLRAGPTLTHRWSWTVQESREFEQSAENHELQAEIDAVARAFAAANPGFELWANPQVRSLEAQLAKWNDNDSVGQAAAHLAAAFDRWLGKPEVSRLPSTELPASAAAFLKGAAPMPPPPLAAPGLSAHGQNRAVDFQVRRNGRTIAGPDASTVVRAWDDAGWTLKLKTAVESGSRRFVGPLESPREPWHYTYVATGDEPQPVERTSSNPAITSNNSSSMAP